MSAPHWVPSARPKDKPTRHAREAPKDSVTYTSGCHALGKVKGGHSLEEGEQD